MKKAINILQVFTIIIVGLVGCKGDNVGPGKNDGLTKNEKLSGAWVPGTVTVNGTDVTGDFSGFKLTLSPFADDEIKGTYSTTQNDLIYESGDYSLQSNEGIGFLGPDGDALHATLVLSNEDKTMTLSFNNPSTIYGGGRGEGLAGDYVFILNKQ